MYWFLGGDSRSPWAVKYLQQKGLEVHCCHVPGLPHEELPDHIPRLILPAPSVKNGRIPGCEDFLIEALGSKLSPNSRVYCMKAGALARELIKSGAQVTDLYDTEPYTTRNAMATAEGAVFLAMGNTLGTLEGSACLVIGAGRIGTLLSEKLSALGAKVTLCARKAKDRALAEARAWATDETGVYRKGLSSYDILFNTVPAAVLDGEQVKQVNKNCLLIELASAPGGFDPAICKDLGLQVLCAQGLPGSYCPKAAGEYYASAILEQEGFL